MADPRRIREMMGFGYGAPSPAMSALEPFHAGVDPQYMPQDVVTESPGDGPSSYVRSGLESLLGLFAPSDRAAAETADKLNAVADFNPLQGAYDTGKAIGDAVQGGDKLSLAMSMIPGKAADDVVPLVKEAQKRIRGYHGSNVPGLTEFDPSKAGTATDAGQLGQGIYLSTDRKVAEGYPHQYEADVGLSNPLQLSMPDWKTDKAELVKAQLGLPKDADAAAVSEALRARGHDGVVLDYSPAGYAHQEMMVLDPKNASIVPAVKAAQKKIKAYHTAPEPFAGDYDWSRLGQTTHPNVEGMGDLEDYSMNLAKIGPWASETPLGKRVGAVDLDVDIGGEGKEFSSLDALEAAVREAGGPEEFRDLMSRQGYGHIKVNDEEFSTNSFIGLAPENFKMRGK